MAQWTPGRPKGALNRKTQQFQAILEERGFNLAEAFLDIRDEAAKQYNKCDSFDPIAAVAALKLLRDVTADIASYSLPKLKSVEMPVQSQLEGLSLQEKIKVLKDATALYEAQAAESLTEGPASE